VRMFFEDSSGNESAHFVLLKADEITNNEDNNDFETRIIDIDTLSFNTDIKKIVIYIDDLDNPFNFFIDQIVLQRAVFLPPEGKMLLRYSASAPIVFSTIDWNATLPAGTNLRVRARGASGTALLNRANYTSWLFSGQQVSLRGTDIEIEIVFLSDVDHLFGPTLEQLRIVVLADAEIEGFEIDEVDEITRGTLTNAQMLPTTGDLADISLQTPIYVDSHYFALGDSTQQIYYDQSNPDEPFNRSEIAVFGTNTPISPNHILARIEKDGPTKISSSSFFDPKNVIRLANRNFLVADTFNDRILEMDDSGAIVNGFGSINYSFNKLFPIAACVDTRSGILYVIWSRPLPFKIVKVSKMTVKNAVTDVPLKDNYDKPAGYTSAELAKLNLESQVMPIHLMDQNFELIKNMTGDVYLDVMTDVIEGGIATGQTTTTSNGEVIDASSEYYRAIKTFNGIPCFVGKFAYITGIFAPTYTNTTIDDGWTIANARIGVKEFKKHKDVTTGDTFTRNTAFSDIIEINSSGEILWGAPLNWVNFSPFVPGRAEQLDRDTMLIAGIKPAKSVVATPAALDFTYLSGDSTKQQAQKNVLKETYKDSDGNGLVGTAGVITRYSTSGWAYTSGPYTSAENILVSDADINASGYMVVAETSFVKSGRIIVVDNFGNVSWSYGEGTYSMINNLNVKSNGLMVLST